MEDVKITPVLKRTQIKVKVIEIYTQVLGIGIKGQVNGQAKPF